ncbi:MAG TPA: hypothetical protein VFX58_07425 [Chitinophagaceae bacterium]|nr:hypothetical protein [Chitinophagaceae bacterium]
MKLAPLLAQFLYSHKRLDLTGIGSFMLDSSVSIDSEDVKQQKNPAAGGIHFQNNPSIKGSPELVSFISSQTGKMKALAEADLNSHLELIRQFLNIGKPFLLEGIGSLVKIRSGQFDFTAGELSAEKLKDSGSKEANATQSPEEKFETYHPFLEKEKTRTAWRKPVMALLVLAGMGLAVLGGYIVYKKNALPVNRQDSTPANIPIQSVAVPIMDSIKKDSANPEPVQVPIPAGHYKFVLETAGPKRAFDRFNKLKTYRWNVQLETADSIRYKIVMQLPTQSTDTSRVLDSLTALNGRKVYIEN